MSWLYVMAKGQRLNANGLYGYMLTRWQLGHGYVEEELSEADVLTKIAVVAIRKETTKDGNVKREY